MKDPRLYKLAGYHERSVLSSISRLFEYILECLYVELLSFDCAMKNATNQFDFMPFFQKGLTVLRVEANRNFGIVYDSVHLLEGRPSRVKPAFDGSDGLR